MLLPFAPSPAQRPDANPALPTSARTPQEKIGQLLQAIRGNQAPEGGNLFEACGATNIKKLLFAMEDAAFLFPSSPEPGGQAALLNTGEVRTAIEKERPLLVCQRLISNDDVRFDYDPDRLVFNASFAADLRADLDFQKIGPYMPGPVGMKATKRESYIDIEYHVSMPTLPNPNARDCIRIADGRIGFALPASPLDAAKMQKSGRLAIVGRLIPPYFSQTSGPSRPKWPSPTTMDIYQVRLKAYFAPLVVAVVMPDGREAFRCSVT